VLEGESSVLFGTNLGAAAEEPGDIAKKRRSPDA